MLGHVQCPSFCRWATTPRSADSGVAAVVTVVTSFVEWLKSPYTKQSKHWKILKGFKRDPCVTCVTWVTELVWLVWLLWPLGDASCPIFSPCFTSCHLAPSRCPRSQCMEVHPSGNRSTNIVRAFTASLLALVGWTTSWTAGKFRSLSTHLKTS